MAETAAVELVLCERARLENWSREELRLALICAGPMLTAEEIERVVEAIVAAAAKEEGSGGADTPVGETATQA